MTKAIITGGGIGGLAAALSLHEAGIDVTVFESAAEIRPLGVGINLLPNACRELCDLGLQTELDRIAIRTRAMCYYTRRGKLVIRSDCGVHAGYRWPQFSVHRGEFQLLMARVFAERAGAAKLVTGHRLVHTHQDESRVTAQFAGPNSDDVIATVQADILIGADGLHSAARKQLLPHEGRPLFSGMVTFRGSTLAPPYLGGESMIIVGDRRQRLVSYPISRQAQLQGESHINWIAAFPSADGGYEESWTNLADPMELAEHYRDWKFDWLDIPALLEATDKVLAFPVYDRDPLPRWTFGRVTLLGDAAHPLIPVSSSGAVQAIIDGRALAFALARHADPLDALQAYQTDRLPKANAVVLASRENGPDEVLEIARKKVPDDARNVHDYVNPGELKAVLDDFKEKAGLGVDTLNNRPSYQITSN